MEYGDFLIETREEDGAWVGRVKRKDGKHFTIRSTIPYALFPWADTMSNFPTESEAVEAARIIADAAAIVGR